MKIWNEAPTLAYYMDQDKGSTGHGWLISSKTVNSRQRSQSLVKLQVFLYQTAREEASF